MEAFDIKEFDEIRPYEAGEMKGAFETLLQDRQFSKLLQGFVPWIPKGVRNGLLRLAFMGVKTPLDFQLRFMKPVVWYAVRKCTDGLTFDDSRLSQSSTLTATPHAQGENPQTRYTFVSNHRDIVLDSAFLDVLLNKNHYPTTVEIGIGDNLLIYPWIKTLVRMNKAFTVRRGLTAHEMMRSSQLMSRYIHYAVTQKHENIWIAQREGRAKDSSDHTQESVLKMLAMGGDLSELNIVPLTISYEYDPCDYLKAREMQQKRDNPAFKKSKQDDLDNMRTGIMGYKGRVHYHCAPSVNTWLDELKDLPKKEYFEQLAHRMDREIHANYRLFPGNWIAFDMLVQKGVWHLEDDERRKSDSRNTLVRDAAYTTDDVKRFENYLAGQLAKIRIPDKDEDFLRQQMLTMYANPVRNLLATLTL